jgi:beta-phosphoglucomutase
LIERLIEEGQFKVFRDAQRLAVAMHQAGLRLALASSSRKAAAM